MASTRLAWGVQYTLTLPSEGAARAAAAELSGMGHRLTAVRARRAIGSDLPRCCPAGKKKIALAALAALCGTRDQRVLSGLAALPAPAGSSRADVVSLMAALLRDNREGLAPALDRLGSWLPRVAEKAASPSVDLQSLGLAILPGLVLEDVVSGIAVGRDLSSPLTT